MEIANSSAHDLQVRRAEERDLPLIAEIVQHGPYSHIHVDWRVPRHWLEAGAFMVVEMAPESSARGLIQGCLALGADPPPAAWVRLAALRGRYQATRLLGVMLEACLEQLAAEGVGEVGWLPRGSWPQQWMESLGFSHIDEVVTYVKLDLGAQAPLSPNERLTIREVQTADLPRLVEIEAAAFDPIWRHSVESLSIGRQYALSFHVAELDGRVVGFQYSSDSDVPQAGHLVRLTVDPAAQRCGVGSALLAAALESYRERGFTEASLNTQLSNLPSRRLYEKFGFKSAGYHWPVWWRGG